MMKKVYTTTVAPPLHHTQILSFVKHSSFNIESIKSALTSHGMSIYYCRRIYIVYVFEASLKSILLLAQRVTVRVMSTFLLHVQYTGCAEWQVYNNACFVCPSDMTLFVYWTQTASYLIFLENMRCNRSVVITTNTFKCTYERMSYKVICVKIKRNENTQKY